MPAQAELLPPPSPEDLRPLPIMPEELGSMALRAEAMTEAELMPDYYVDLDAEAEIIGANANGVDARLEDIGRIHDPAEAHEQATQEKGYVRDAEQAREMALAENEIFDVYDEAVRENEIFDAYTEALAENEVRQAKIEAEQKAQAEAEAAAAEKDQKLADIREEAKQALRENGHIQELPYGTQVHKDPQTGNLVVVLDDVVKVIEPNDHGKPFITDFVYFRGSGILKVSTEGTSHKGTKVENGDYIPINQLPEGYKPRTADILPLPRMAARALGFKQVVLLPHDHRARETFLRSAA